MQEIDDQARPRLAAGVRFQVDPATGRSVLLYPEGIVELNETSQEIIRCCDGRTVSDLVIALAREYDADPSTVAADVRETLADLRHRKLLEFT
jgi:coenzyme PQQ biosynthesis protein PqqD